MTTLRDKAIAAVEAVGYLPIDAEEIVDALLAAGMLTDPEEGVAIALGAATACVAAGFLAATLGSDDLDGRGRPHEQREPDDPEDRLAAKAWRRARDAAGQEDTDA